MSTGNASGQVRISQSLLSWFSKNINSVQRRVSHQLETMYKTRNKVIQSELEELQERASRALEMVKTMKSANADAEHKTDLGVFQAMYRDCQRQIRVLDLERYFPGYWQFKVNTEEGMYLGFRDSSVEYVRARIELKAGDGCVEVKIKDLIAALQLYNFTLKGRGLTSMLASFFSPSRVDAVVRGSVTMRFTYSAKGDANAKVKRKRKKDVKLPAGMGKPLLSGGWVVDKQHTKFDLHVEKDIRGAATLPDGVINYLLKSFLPNLIIGKLLKKLPLEMGTFWSKIYPDPDPAVRARDASASTGNEVTVLASLKVSSDMTLAVWTVPLDEGTGDARLARALLNQGADEKHLLTRNRASLLAKLCKHAGLSGLKSKLNLQHLYEYFTKYHPYAHGHAADAGSFKLSTAWNVILELWFIILSGNVHGKLDKEEMREKIALHWFPKVLLCRVYVCMCECVCVSMRA
jgi:hypothetical protein